MEQLDPSFFGRVGSPPLEAEEVVETRLAPPGLGDPAQLEAFDKSLDGRTSRLVDWSARAPRVVADAVRHVLGRADLSDEEALALALDPAHNPYRLERLNVSTPRAADARARARALHLPQEALAHGGLAGPAPPHGAGVAPAALAQRAGARRRRDAGADRRRTPAAARSSRRWSRRSGRRARGCSTLGVAPELALYVLPNALAVRFEESGNLLDLLHKWTMRTCLNAQWEIWRASMDELEQVRAVHPGAGGARRSALLRARRARAAALHGGQRTSAASRCGAASPRRNE